MWQDVAELVIYLCDQAFTRGVYLLAQSAVLIAMGLVLSRLLRGKGAALQSMILRVTLSAVLLCPAASVGLGLLGVEGVSLRSPDERPDEPEAEVTNSRRAADQGAGVTMTTVSPNTRPRASLSVDPVVPSGHASRAGERSGIVLFRVGATGAWIAVASALLAQLAFSHRRLWRARQCARVAAPTAVAVCQTIAREMGLRTPAFLCTRLVASPCLTGCLRPAILIPVHDDSRGVAVTSDVLVHELAHLARHDCVWNLLGRLAQSLLFFQPLLWVLVRRIEDVSDDVADDYVVQFGADRRTYAHRLTDLAERFLPTRYEAAAGVGVIRLRSSLGRRVLRILDTTRMLSTRSRARTVGAIAAIGLCTTLGVGLIGAAPDPIPDAIIAKRGRATLPNGTTCELLGIRRCSGAAQRWWSPDGATLDRAPCESTKEECEPTHEVYELAVGLKGAAPLNDRTETPEQWEVQGGQSGGRYGKREDHTGRSLHLRGTTAVVRKGTEAITVRIGIALGPWETRTSVGSETGTKTAFRDVGCTFMPPREEDGRTRIDVHAGAQKATAHRVVAILKGGKQVTSAGWRRHPGIVFLPRKETFDFLNPLSAIARFEFQTCDYQWVEFRDVPLRPKVESREERADRLAEYPWLHLKYDNGRERWTNLIHEQHFFKHADGRLVFLDYVRGRRQSYYSEWSSTISEDEIGAGAAQCTPWECAFGHLEEQVRGGGDGPPRVEKHTETVDGKQLVRFDVYHTDALDRRILLRQFWGDETTRLPVRTRERLQLAHRKEQSREWTTGVYDFPKTGPSSIYDIGAPRDAKIVVERKEDDTAPDVQRIVDAGKQAQQRLPRRHRVVVWKLRDSGEVDVIHRDSEKVRHERYFHLRPGSGDGTHHLPLPATAREVLEWTYDQPPISISVCDGEKAYRRRCVHPAHENPREPTVRVLRSRGTTLLSSSGRPLENQWPYFRKGLKRLTDVHDAAPGIVVLRRESGDIRRDYYVDPEHDYTCVKWVWWRQRDGIWCKEREYELSGLVTLPGGQWYATKKLLRTYPNPAKGWRGYETEWRIDLAEIGEDEIPLNAFVGELLLEGARLESY